MRAVHLFLISLLTCRLAWARFGAGAYFLYVCLLVSRGLANREYETCDLLTLWVGIVADKTALSMQAIKYVYAVKSNAFPGLIKIGRTQNVKERLSQLNTSCAPSPFVVVAESPTLDYVRDEKMAHEFFKSKRRNGEFFSVTESEIIEFFKTVKERFDVELSQPRNIESDADKEARQMKFMHFFCGNLVKNGLAHESSCHAELKPVYQQGPDDPTLDDLSRKRKREDEDCLLDMERERELNDLEVMKRKIAVEERQLVLKRSKMEFQLEKVQKSATLIQLINGMHGINEHTKLQFVDYVKDIVFDQMPALAKAPTTPLTVRMLVDEMGLTCTEAQLEHIELEMAKRYREIYNRDPPQILQWVPHSPSIHQRNQPPST